MKRALILAGGYGKRMKSPTPKVLHEILGKKMIEWVIDAARIAGAEEIGIVVGHNAEEIKSILPDDVKVFLQEEQLGTANAVKCAQDFLQGTVAILYGDVPLITPKTIKKLFSSTADMAILTAEVPDSSGYGRIVRKNGKIEKIVEELEASKDVLNIKEVNSGIYVFKAKALKYALDAIRPSKIKGEYYLTDAVEILLKSGYTVEGIQVSDYTEILGANTQKELSKLAELAKKRILDSLMENGVTVEDPRSVFIGPDAAVEAGSVIRPFTFIYGRSVVKSRAVIGPETTLIDTYVGERSRVVRSECEGARISEDVSVGPFSRLRPGTVLEKRVKVGNFVEVKKSHLEEGVKASHLTYLGDANIGTQTNIGAGTITCNYDGKKKNKTYVGEKAFIGSNTSLVAPVKVGKGALVGAGSVITEDVPPFALALGRARQVNKMEWVLKKREEENEK